MQIHSSVIDEHIARHVMEKQIGVQNIPGPDIQICLDIGRYQHRSHRV